MRFFRLTSVSTLLGALLVVPLPASAEIYKCTETKEVIKLQNFPCSMDSIGWVPPAGSAVATPNAAATGALPVATPSPASTSASPLSALHTLRAMVPTGEEPNGDEPYPGMTMDQVKAEWGGPKWVKQINGIEIWFYDGPRDSTRGVRFDRNRKVIGIGDEDWQPGPNGG